MRTSSIAAAVVVASFSLSAQAVPIIGTFSLTGDNIVTDPNFMSPTNITINPGATVGDEEGITTGAVSGGFTTLLPSLMFFPGSTTTLQAAPFGVSDQSGGFLKGSLGGLTIASGTTILWTDNGATGQGNAGVQLRVVLTQDLLFSPLSAEGFNFIVGGAKAMFSTNASGWDPTPGEITFSTQQSGGSNENSWSASFSTAAAPVPGPLALVGLGLGLLGAVRRRLHRA